MTPEEVLLLLKEAADAFTAISGKPADNDLTRVKKVIYPLLLSVTYDSDSLANAATSGHLKKSKLVSLAASLDISEANCAALTATNANLVKALATLKAGAVPGDGWSNKTRDCYAKRGYCWTHGYKVGAKHTSSTCKAAGSNPKHKQDSTRSNPMGGIFLNKGWDD